MKQHRGAGHTWRVVAAVTIVGASFALAAPAPAEPVWHVPQADCALLAGSEHVTAKILVRAFVRVGLEAPCP